MQGLFVTFTDRKTWVSIRDKDNCSWRRARSGFWLTFERSHACLTVQHVKLKILPAPSDTTHDLLGRRVFAASTSRSCQSRQPTCDNFPRECARKGIRGPDLFPFFRYRLEGWVDAFDEESMGNRVHDCRKLRIEWVLGIPRDINIHGSIERWGIYTRARYRPRRRPRRRRVSVTRRRRPGTDDGCSR